MAKSISWSFISLLVSESAKSESIKNSSTGCISSKIGLTLLIP